MTKKRKERDVFKKIIPTTNHFGNLPHHMLSILALIVQHDVDHNIHDPLEKNKPDQLIALNMLYIENILDASMLLYLHARREQQLHRVRYVSSTKIYYAFFLVWLVSLLK